MYPASYSPTRRLEAIVAIISRNVFLLINAIIFSVVVLLTLFGSTQEGIFLGFITVLNIIIGSTQEISSWLTLEKLQLLAVPRVVRIAEDGTESTILTDEVKVHDRLKLSAGDQVPCDGSLVTSHGFQVNEALITGESSDFLKTPGDALSAGSIVTAGTGVLLVKKVFAESRIALMTKSIKKYSLIQSPIQHAINTLIKYIGYVLLLIILFVWGRGVLTEASTVSIIQSIGALTSILLPQGMVVVITLLFSYGAAHLYRRHVLLQEVNATEKLGRIENLCMDKTGTLTGDELTVEHTYLPRGVHETYAQASMAGYIKGTEDSSRTIAAVKESLSQAYAGTILEDLAFSSSRQFGAARLEDEFGERIVLAGAPDIFLPYFETAQDKEWVQQYIDSEAKYGKRLVCFVQANGSELPSRLPGTSLSAIALSVIQNNLREGVVEAVRFFQDRGVTIRIISGDSPETVQAIAEAAGVHTPQAVIRGAELETWTDAEYLENAHRYTIFARVKPEQKEKIIEALKQRGFTAMIGDGANDALAIKKADLGIAMFDGAQATRQVASVVLVKNSFIDLPNGVRLADSIIQNIELCASIFLNQVFFGFFFFILLAVFGHAFPFTPLNIAFITYFTIGLPSSLIFYWVIRPVHERVEKPEHSFLGRVIPFALVSAIPQAFVAAAVFYGNLGYISLAEPMSLMVPVFIIVGVVFFMCAPSVYTGPTTRIQKRQFYLLAGIELLAVVVLMNTPLVVSFYNLTPLPLVSVLELVPLLSGYVLLQYALARWFRKKKSR